jgi:hypothetical protein
LGGPTVNTQAQQAEQANQVQGEQYAAQQQAAAVAAINAYLKGNPAPNSTAAPLQAPSASSPATIGGGTAPGSAGAMRPPPTAQPQPPQGAPGAQPQPPRPQLNPQQLQAIMTRLAAQGGGRMPQ